MKDEKIIDEVQKEFATWSVSKDVVNEIAEFMLKKWAEEKKQLEKALQGMTALYDDTHLQKIDAISEVRKLKEEKKELERENKELKEELEDLGQDLIESGEKG